jgi:hypothetical protein
VIIGSSPKHNQLVELPHQKKSCQGIAAVKNLTDHLTSNLLIKTKIDGEEFSDKVFVLVFIFPFKTLSPRLH